MTETGAKRGRPRKAASRASLKPTPVKIPLNTLEDVRREMARVYREARAGKLDTAEASKLSFMLQGLGKMIEATVIERRIDALENGGQEAIAYDDSTDTAHDVIDVDAREAPP